MYVYGHRPQDARFIDVDTACLISFYIIPMVMWEIVHNDQLVSANFVSPGTSATRAIAPIHPDLLFSPLQEFPWGREVPQWQEGQVQDGAAGRRGFCS